MSYTILKQFLLPPGVLILLFLFGFLLVRGVLGRVFIFIALTVLTLMSLPVVAAMLMVGIESYGALEPGHLSDTGAEAILVLGGDRYAWAPEYGGDTVGGYTLQRLRYGAFLYRQTGLPVYVTGGNPPIERPPIGQLMARVLEGEYGVPVAGVEDRSLTTRENALFSAKMLGRDGIGHVLLVTHASHMPRAVESFERVNIMTTPAPTYFGHQENEGEHDYRHWLPSVGAFNNSYVALHEYAGRVWYQLKATIGGRFAGTREVQSTN